MIVSLRTKEQIQQDFFLCCDLLNKGKTWTEIHLHINKIRKYSIGRAALQQTYQIRLKQAAINVEATNQVERAIEDLDAIMAKALIGYNRSVGTEEKITSTKGSNSKGVYESEVIATMKMNGDTKYLGVYLKAFDKKAKLLGWEKPKEFNISHFLKDNQIDDSGGASMTPIRSESEAKEYGEGLTNDPLF